MTSIDSALMDAYIYTFPFYEMARTRHFAVQPKVPQGPSQLNTMTHLKNLSDHKARSVTSPNNDTLYSTAWLDLSTGPIELTVPRIVDRYWSVQFMDASSVTAALVGSNNAGEGDVKVWIANTHDQAKAPNGTREVRLASRDVWILVRIVVDGPEDLPNVHELQAHMTLTVTNIGANPTQAEPVLAQGSPVDGSNYLRVVNDMLARNPEAGVPKAIPSTWQAFGFGVQATPAQGEALTAVLAELNETLMTQCLTTGTTSDQGWILPTGAVGTFGSDYQLRAEIALKGLAALPREEALYINTSTDSKNQALTGQSRYCLSVPASGIPTQAFWSFSMYQIDPDGRSFFVDNAINRYTIGDRTPGLVKGADGSLDIYLQCDEPSDPHHKANWLPTPAGNFRLMLRAYLPSEAMNLGQVALPTVAKLE